MNSSDTQVTGCVRSVNEKGLKLDGYDDWFNVSKFAVGVVLPERGQQVTCTLDKGGFLRAVTISDGSDIAPSRNGAPGATTAQRDRTISRLAVLKAAAEFGAARPNLKSGDVLTIAASWERWVTRSDDDAQTVADVF
jgi:hypothetical protein